MSPQARSLSPGDSIPRAIWHRLRSTLAGRALLAGLVLKLLAWLVGLVAPGRSFVEAIDTVGDVGLVTGVVVLGWQAFTRARGALLWRVRSKLILSYIFIGFVPVFLVIVLFLTSGLVLFFNVSQYVASSGVRSLVDQTAFLAESAAVGLQDVGTEEELRERLDRRQAGAVRTFPHVSYAIVPATRTCGAVSDDEPLAVPPPLVTVGPWSHLDPPEAIPDWLGHGTNGLASDATCAGSAELIAYSEAVTDRAAGVVQLVARAVAWPDVARPYFAVVVDVPFGAELHDRIRIDTDIEIGDVTPILTEECVAVDLHGRAFEPPLRPVARERTSRSRWNPLEQPREWVAVLPLTDWTTGRRDCRALMRISMTLGDLYTRISPVSGAALGGGTMDLNRLLPVFTAFIAVLFLIIQAAALVMGLALARSITGSVHELFAGTVRVRRGDFGQRIAIRSRDQLGDLAESFNAMTASIEDLLQQKAEKERLAQELRIARTIQMSLLPQGRLFIPGLLLTAHCEPAREVGGDYYDFLPVDDHRFGLLIADVAGKGTSAALYMAELKGLMLSLSQLHTSPRRLLIDANRIIARHLDTRSFITITYAVVDTQARTLTYARAGHCPLIYVPGPGAASRAAQILAPNGLVLGLQIDDGQRFNQLLEEATLPLHEGDLFLFYTDGLTDVMDADGNCFGDARLAALMREHADLPFDELRERILHELAAFGGSADQHDDMTMLLLKVDETAVRHG